MGHFENFRIFRFLRGLNGGSTKKMQLLKKCQVEKEIYFQCKKNVISDFGMWGGILLPPPCVGDRVKTGRTIIFLNWTFTEKGKGKVKKYRPVSKGYIGV